VDRLLAPHGFFRAARACWLRASGSPRAWVYAHIDTKPPIPRDEWRTDPFSLVEKSGRLFGLGISDAKFQLLNALDVFSDPDIGFVVDGEEEIGGSGAAEILAAADVDVLVIVDGATSSARFFSGTAGQIDGQLRLKTGSPRLHPSRAIRRELWQMMSDVFGRAAELKMHFNWTGLSAPESVRSLSLEEAVIRFDLRYQRIDAPVVGAFLEPYDVEIRQHYQPLEGICHQHDYPLASFSCALGNTLSRLNRVVVAPGAFAQNGNHRPNEWIDFTQIIAHRIRLEKVRRSCFSPEVQHDA